MPELPEVETVMRGMEAALRGGRIAHVDVRRKDLRVPFPKDLAKKLEGRTMAQFSRRAKYVLVRMDDGQVLVIHLGMSGRIQLVGKKEEFAPGKHDHLVVAMKDGQRFALNDARRFGVVLLLPEDKVEGHASFKTLGPEPLGNGFDATYLESKLKGRKTAVKVAIMDQRIVVGVGNIYACEALYQAGIDPRRAAGKVTRAELDKLVPAIRDVLGRAIAAGGSTLRDYKQADGELGYFQHEFKVYGREGEKCPVRGCGCAQQGGVQRIVQGGRSTFFCPVRQG
jgi:formamidopyrimidine-DNA glycosylase